MSRAPYILIVDDDPEMRRYLRRVLRDGAYRSLAVAPGPGSSARLGDGAPDLLILDLDGGDGPETIARVRDSSPVPILALSSRRDEGSMAAAIESGADDYLVKPFGSRELLARVYAALRHGIRDRGTAPLFASSDLTIDLARRRVWRAGHEVHLAAKPYLVLSHLVAAAGETLRHDDLLARIWGPDKSTRRDYLRLAIQRLRSVLEPDPAQPIHIVTVHGIGYRFQVQPTAIGGTMAPRNSQRRRRA